MIRNKATVLGLMSGSSLDGLDACLCTFWFANNNWSYEILESKTLSIPQDLRLSLEVSSQLNAIDLLALDIKYGQWIANAISDLSLSAGIISIHGHTVFHDPKNQISLQIGSGEAIALHANKPVVSNFRNTDILLGGQGAPLVPLGEKLLFPDFDGFVNLGGICNASFIKDNKVLAGDIGPFNQVFNFHAKKMGHDIDKNGELSRSGKRIESLIGDWNKNPYFEKPFPKSLANQWVSTHFLTNSDFDSIDVMHSFAHFITDQISSVINKHGVKKIMVTGGGVYHKYAMDLLEEKCDTEIVKPSDDLINYKEALIFGLLGLLRFRGEINVLASSTGASRDSSSGVVYPA